MEKPTITFDWKKISIAAGALAFAFLAGFLPQRRATVAVQDRLAEREAHITALEHELVAARLEGRLGVALAEAHRGNYERARQLTSSFYTDLATLRGATLQGTQIELLAEFDRQRDEIITLLSRAVPESTQRLAMMTTAYYAAMDPHADVAPTSITPVPADTTTRR